MLKKMMLLASMALAAIAFAAPVAQATGPNVSGAEAFEGKLEFHIKAGFPGAGSSFGCQVTSTIVGLGNDEANVETFNPTTSTCTGTGIFAGCKLKADKSNAPFLATTTTAGDFVVTKPGENITIHNEYENCPNAATSHLLFAQVTVTPDPAAGLVETLTVEGTSTNTAITATGTIHAEGTHGGLEIE